MREPSIHISWTDFRELVQEINLRISEEKSRELFAKARARSLDHRSFLSNSMVMTRKVTQRVSSSIGDANLLSRIIYSVRIKLKHIGVTQINQADSQWGALKELVPIINQFCKAFNLSKKEGYTVFVETGLEIMAKYNKRGSYNFIAQNLKSKASDIMDRYQAKKTIKEDQYPQETKKLYDLYQGKVFEITGIYSSNNPDPQEYTPFIQARELADKIGIDYDTFMEAQFEALDFCNGIPQLRDLYNDKAQQRLTQYLSKHHIQLVDIRRGDSPSKEISEDTWDMFKEK